MCYDRLLVSAHMRLRFAEAGVWLEGVVRKSRTGLRGYETDSFGREGNTPYRIGDL